MTIQGMIVHKIKVICLCLFCLGVFESHAYWPWSGKKAEKNEITKIAWRELSVEEEERFCVLADSRRQIREEIAMLERLLEETKTDQKNINQKLKLVFSVDSDKSYRFDQTANTLYLVTPPAPAASGNASPANGHEGQEAVHKVLSAPQAKFFSQLAERKMQNQAAIQGLLVLTQRKLSQWGSVCDELLGEFGIERDRDYHYDKETRMVYQLVPPSAPTE